MDAARKSAAGVHRKSGLGERDWRTVARPVVPALSGAATGGGLDIGALVGPDSRRWRGWSELDGDRGRHQAEDGEVRRSYCAEPRARSCRQ